MDLLRPAGRLLLSLVFVAGAWEDILPGINGIDCHEPPWGASLPAGSIPSSDADDDAGDGFVLHVSPPEQILITEADAAMPIPLHSQVLQSLSQDVPPSIFVRRIPHVPKPAFRL
jgi:hypothetical protein